MGFEWLLISFDAKNQRTAGFHRLQHNHNKAKQAATPAAAKAHKLFTRYTHFKLLDTMDFSKYVLSTVTSSNEAVHSSKKTDERSPHTSPEFHDHVPMKNFQSLRSTDTAITTSTSSDEFYAQELSESSSCDATETPRRHRYERSLTDHEYNLFLDFLESPSCTTPKRDIPDQVIADQDQASDELDFLESPTRNSSNAGFFTRDGCPDDEIAVPHIRRTMSQESSGFHGGCQDIMALSALAALLGTNIQPNHMQEKKNRGIKNLWAEDCSDDDMISLPDI